MSGIEPGPELAVKLASCIAQLGGSLLIPWSMSRLPGLGMNNCLFEFTIVKGLPLMLGVPYYM